MCETLPTPQVHPAMLLPSLGPRFFPFSQTFYPSLIGCEAAAADSWCDGGGLCRPLLDAENFLSAHQSESSADFCR